MQTSLIFHSFGESFGDFLNNFILADYRILIAGITLSLLLGVIAYVKIFKTKIYFFIILALISFIIVKGTQMLYCLKYEDKFLITTIIFLAALFILYILFLVTENNQMIYTLVSMGDKNISSEEGALKYFLLGAMASGLFILGVNLLYGVTGKTNFAEISEFGSQQNSMIILGLLLLLFGLLFKIVAVPFHLWLPDTYEGAPFYVLLFLVSFPKLGLFYVIFNLNNMLEANTLIVFSLMLSAILGRIQAVEQTKIKRFIVYTVIFNNAFFLSMVLLTGHNAFYSLVESLIFYIIITVTMVTIMQKYVNEMEKIYSYIFLHI